MNELEVRTMALTLMQANDLLRQGWKFSFFNSKNTIGRCFHGRKEIQFSKPFLQLTEDEVKDTLLHEIAHALAGQKAGHGWEWKKICLVIGATPNATATKLTASPDSKWTGVCPNGHTLKRHAVTQKSRKVACSRCCNELNGGRYSADYRFTFYLTEDYEASKSDIMEAAAARKVKVEETKKPIHEGLSIIEF